MKLTLQDKSTVDVTDAAFNVAFNEPLVHQVVTAYLAGSRSGTKAQKNRSSVQGGGAKPWRQKGTGRARAGSNRSPLWRGGGVIFGPKFNKKKIKINKKERNLALHTLLYNKRNKTFLFENLEYKNLLPKTKFNFLYSTQP